MFSISFIPSLLTKVFIVAYAENSKINKVPPHTYASGPTYSVIYKEHLGVIYVPTSSSHMVYKGTDLTMGEMASVCTKHVFQCTDSLGLI